MEIYNFLPTYPDFNKETQDILGKELVDVSSLFYKKEFHDLRLEKKEIPPTEPGKYMNHQQLLARFLSSNTPYQSILVMHEPGTGKSCLSVAIIEQIRSEDSSFKGALILMKSDDLIANYKKELVERCTDGRYKAEKLEEDEDLTDNKTKRRINKNLESFYHFDTFQTFGSTIEKMKKKSIQQEYNHFIIVIDEVHNLRLNKDGQYNRIHTFLHTVQNCKVILMTGTPMKDQPYEIASIMNLINDSDHQLPTKNEFMEEYMIETGKKWVINPDKVEDFKNMVNGKISFLRSIKSSVQKKYVGEHVDVDCFYQFPLEMKDHQMSAYSKAIHLDKQIIDKDIQKNGKREKGRGVYNNSRQAILFSFPGNLYGQEGFAAYKDNFTTLFKQMKVGAKNFADVKTDEERLDILSHYSSKYAACIKCILDHPKANHFVYMEFVNGSGAIVFSHILKKFGYNTKGGENYKRYILLTSETVNIEKDIERFNQPKNVDGKLINVIIGTDIISEGYTLKNIQYIHILTPSWNFSETDQVIARGIRLNSHAELEKINPNVTVHIYLYTNMGKEAASKSIERNKKEYMTIKRDHIPSIDRYMFAISEDKDIAIKSIEYILRQVSMDCLLNEKRNMLPDRYDGKRECEYQTCEITCDEDKKTVMDLSTYHLFYDQYEIEQLIVRLKMFFELRGWYTINEIMTEMKCDRELLLKTLIYMIEHKTVVIERDGIMFFLHHDNDYVFVSSLITDANWFDYFYTEYIPFHFNNDFQEKVDVVYHHFVLDTIKKMCQTNDQRLLQKLDISIQELLLEVALTFPEKPVNPFREMIVTSLKNYWYKKDHTIVSILLGEKKKRCLYNGEKVWKDCVDEKHEHKHDEEYEYYLEKDQKTGESIFKIKKLVEEEIENKAKKPRGVVCHNAGMGKDELLLIVHRNQLPYEKDDEDEDQDEDEIDESLLEILEDKYVKRIEDNIEVTRDNLLRMRYFANMSKPEICAKLQKFFIG